MSYIFLLFISRFLSAIIPVSLVVIFCLLHAIILMFTDLAPTRTRITCPPLLFLLTPMSIYSTGCGFRPVYSGQLEALPLYLLLHVHVHVFVWTSTLTLFSYVHCVLSVQFHLVTYGQFKSLLDYLVHTVSNGNFYTLKFTTFTQVSIGYFWKLCQTSMLFGKGTELNWVYVCLVLFPWHYLDTLLYVMLGI